MSARRSRPAKWLGGAALLLCCGVYGVAAAINGMDRVAATHPALAQSFPVQLSSDTLGQKAQALYTQGQPGAAKDLAVRMIDAAPVDPGSTAMLGAARLAQGDAAGAEKAMLVAAQLGWRIQYTQAYWMARALQLGDMKVAALRLDALLRVTPDLVANDLYLQPFETTPEGRAALVARLTLAPDWLTSYVTDVDKLPADRLQRRVTVLQELGASGHPLSCEAASPIVDRLIALGDHAQAHQVWSGSCPGAHQSLVSDGNFQAAAIDQSRSSFSWFFMGQAGVSAQLQPASHGKVLVADSSASDVTGIARQMVLLPAGRYSVSWSAKGDNGAPSARMRVSLGCDANPRHWVEAHLDQASGLWRAEVDHDGACPGAWLIFGMAPGEGAVSLTDIALSPAR